MNRSTRTELAPDFREGARLTWLAMFALGWDQTDLARQLAAELKRRVVPGTVHPWLYGDARPVDETTWAIERLMKRHKQVVPAGSWALLSQEAFDLAKARKDAFSRKRRPSQSAA